MARVFKCVDGVDVKIFASFTASLARWRFETIWEVCTQLLERRDFCEQHFRGDIFGSTKDPELIRNVTESCKWPDLWVWLAAVNKYVVSPLEYIRRWGMKCNCCTDERATNSSSRFHCPRASMRLAEASKYIKEQASHMFLLGRTLRYVDVPVPGVLAEVKRMMAKAASILLLKFAYLDSVPWRFVACDTMEGAIDCLQQIRSKPLEGHEQLTRMTYETHKDDLETVANGGVPSEELVRDVVKLLANTPLDESPGESWHRASNVAKSRAASSRLPYIKASIRFKENVGRVRKFLKRHLTFGPRTVRYEYQNFKIVLQGKPRNFNKAVRLRDKEFYKRVYRIDQDVLDWSLVYGGRKKQSASKPDATNTLKVEYLRSVLHDNTYYSLPIEAAEPIEDGILEARLR